MGCFVQLGQGLLRHPHRPVMKTPQIMKSKFITKEKPPLALKEMLNGPSTNDEEKEPKIISKRLKQLVLLSVGLKIQSRHKIRSQLEHMLNYIFELLMQKTQTIL